MATTPTGWKHGKYVTIALTGRCSCGHTWEVSPGEIKITEGHITDSGTYFPGSMEVRCSQCSGVDSGSWW